MFEEDPKWRLCHLICLNKSKEILPEDREMFLKYFEIPEEIKDAFMEASHYCECCKLLDRYAFLFCKHYTGPAAFILTCLTCENHDGKTCTILDQIVEEEARQWVQRDCHMLIHKPPPRN